jgi:hypothetical protein
MKSNCSTLNKWVRDQVLDRCYYIDRIRLQVNDLSARDPIAEIVRQPQWSVSAKFTPEFEKFTKRGQKTASRIAVGFALELLQPPLPLLAELADSLLQSHYTISWLEVAYDLKLENHDEAMDGLDFLAEMIMVPAISRAPTFSDREQRGTDDDDETSHKSVFWGTYDDSRMFKLYVPAGDRKVFGENSVHTEFLLKGAEEMRRNGLFTLQDLVDLDFRSWYAERVLVRSLDKKAIGAALRRCEAKEAGSDRQCQQDFERVFGAERAMAHRVYHHDEGGLRDGLVKCPDKWLDGPVR